MSSEPEDQPALVFKPRFKSKKKAASSRRRRRHSSDEEDIGGGERGGSEKEGNQTPFSGTSSGANTLENLNGSGRPNGSGRANGSERLDGNMKNQEFGVNPQISGFTPAQTSVKNSNLSRVSRWARYSALTQNQGSNNEVHIDDGSHDMAVDDRIDRVGYERIRSPGRISRDSAIKTIEHGSDLKTHRVASGEVHDNSWNGGQDSARIQSPNSKIQFDTSDQNPDLGLPSNPSLDSTEEAPAYVEATSPTSDPRQALSFSLSENKAFTVYQPSSSTFSLRESHFRDSPLEPVSTRSEYADKYGNVSDDEPSNPARNINVSDDDVGMVDFELETGAQRPRDLGDMYDSELSIDDGESPLKPNYQDIPDPSKILAGLVERMAILDSSITLRQNRKVALAQSLVDLQNQRRNILADL